MTEEDNAAATEQRQTAEEITAFLQRLSRDKHAFGAHLGIHVDRPWSSLQKRFSAEQASYRSGARDRDP
jgi:hypothetical protein